MKILIVGNVGSGKSTFLKLLKKYVNQDYYEFLDLDLVAKKIISENNIVLPEKRTEIFENVELLYKVESQVFFHMKKHVVENQKTHKTLIMEASTIIECPHILEDDDIIIHVSCKNHMAQTFNRDKVENRAELISRVQVSPWIKSIISDIEVTNNEGLEELEEKAKNIALNLNFHKTDGFQFQIDCVHSLWKKQFPKLNCFASIVKKYSSPERNIFNLNYLLYAFDKLEYTELPKSQLWVKALYLAIWFSQYQNEEFDIEQNIKALWDFSRTNNAIQELVEGSRSYISLACELIYSMNENNKSSSLSYGDGLIAYKILAEITK